MPTKKEDHANDTQIEHLPEIAWIIALYRAIHGGDPFNDQTAAAGILAGSVAYLSGQTGGLVSVSKLTAQYEKLALKFKVSAVKPTPRELKNLYPNRRNPSRFVGFSQKSGTVTLSGCRWQRLHQGKAATHLSSVFGLFCGRVSWRPAGGLG
jgi:hypothetical protein